MTTIDIKVKETGIPRGVLEIAEQLPQAQDFRAGQEVTIQFGREFVHLSALVFLAAWRKSLPAGVTVHLSDSRCSSETQRFISNTGFREIIETGHETPSTQRRIGRVPLQPITNHFTTEATVNDVVTIFNEYAGQVKDTEPFKVLISELCENVLAHSEFVSPGYICARVLEGANTAEIAIADTGIGIHDSYMTGTNTKIIERIRKGASPLSLAIEGLNSSKPSPVKNSLRSYYGFGLLVARRLVRLNRGQMFLLSGNESLHLTRNHTQSAQLSVPWQGTFISIVLDLGNPLPLEEVYQQNVEDKVGKLPSFAGQMTVTPEPEDATEDVTEDDRAVLQKAPQDDSPKKVVELRHYGSELLTRDAGTAVRADIASFLAAGYQVEVSLEDVTDITPSVADEAFAKLAESIGHSAFRDRVTFTGGTRIAKRLIDFVLKTRRTKNS